MPKIYKRGKTHYIRGTYCGQTINQSLGVESYEEALIEAGMLLQRMRDGGDVHAGKCTVAEAIDKFIAGGKGNRKESTWKNLILTLNRTVKPYIGHFLISDFLNKKKGVEIFEGFITERRNRGLLDSTTLTVVTAAGMALKAVEPGYKQPSISKTFGLKPSQEKQNTLSEEELLGATIYLDGDFKCVVKVAFYTGMRIGDCAGLRWGQIEGSVLNVRTTKTGKRVTIPIPDQIKPMLSELARVRVIGDDRVFKSVAMTTRAWHCALLRAFKAACKKIGRAEIRLHDLRHSYATLLLRRGVTLHMVMELLGHSSLAMTQRYAHLAVEDKIQAVKKAFGSGE